MVRDRTRRKGSCAGRGLDWISVKNFSAERIVKHWNSLAKAVVKSPSREVIRRCVIVALGLVVGLAELGY